MLQVDFMLGSDLFLFYCVKQDEDDDYLLENVIFVFKDVIFVDFIFKDNVYGLVYKGLDFR